MKVYFIGAGPGAPDLITIRGARILNEAPIVLYAGSLVPQAVLEHCHAQAELVNTAALNLEQQEEIYIRAKQNNCDIARLHSGDPAIYGAVAEQMRRLDKLGISYEVVPGVSSFTASAAAISCELTKPAVSQTIILTRISGRASAVPESESLALLARHKATLCLFLSGPHLSTIVHSLLPAYGCDTPVVLARRVSCPDECIYKSTLGNIVSEVNMEDWKLTTIMLVGDVLKDEVAMESCLYSAAYPHKYRKAVVKR